MNFTRVASSLIAVAGLAGSGVALAGMGETYGRAGGLAKWGDQMTATRAMHAADPVTDNSAERADGPASSGSVSRAGGSVHGGGEQPAWPGRQGRALPIDDVRG